MSGLLRDDDERFFATVERSQDIVDYPPAIVLKDYWVCEVLRALPAPFLFKGGTSLAKGWNLIDRMSEDVDVLVTHRVDDSITAIEDRLKAMTGHVGAVLGLPTREVRPPGRGRQAHRDDLFEYGTLGFGPVGIDTAGVLLQLGYGEGWEPLCVITVQPLLAAAAADAATHADLAGFEVQALLPVRTLIEKLHALHCTVEESADGAMITSRDGRHHYDIFCCLGHDETLRSLRDRDRVELIFRDVERISGSRYGARASRPEAGYAASRAFQPGRGGELRERLEVAYEESHGLLRQHADWPGLGAVLRRIEEHSALL